jgi:eukaryotic-like serine/threonine-protein kinase
LVRDAMICTSKPKGGHDEQIVVEDPHGGHELSAFRAMMAPRELAPIALVPPAAASPCEASDASTRRLGAPASIAEDAGDSLYLREPLERDELPEGTSVGRYSVVGRLGEGGMGVVYQAWDPQLDRMVALKVLRTGRAQHGVPSPDLLLLGEAQTLARIEHPNIVSVYDAGVTSERVFIAMELCRGQNLREWLVRGDHGVREVLDVFMAAGRGLAAAHYAGIVHRDFKPANVLIGEQGAVQVADFGMARLVELSIDADTDVASDSAHDRNVSTIVGTPMYMAPEQLLGRLGDHRMDQFSFCLCLYWALLGESPFLGRTFQERRRVVPLGLGTVERERLSRARHVPVRVRRALLRGLSVDPDERFSSMEVLLAELAERRRWPWVLSSFTLTVGLGLGALAMSEAQEEPCEQPWAALGGSWGEGPRQRLAEAIARTHHPTATEQLERVVGAFDRYAREWIDGYSEACRATYVTYTQSEALFDLRMACLERRRVQLEIAVDTMAHAADLEELDDRMSLPFRLPGIDECSDVATLESVDPLPSDGPTRARIEALMKRIDLANTLWKAGELQDGVVVAHAAVVEAREVGYLPVLAQSLECLGRLQADGASPEAAELTLREAIAVGAHGHDEQSVARAWSSLVYVLMLQGQLAVAESLGFAAEVAVDRAGDETARGWLFNTLGALHSERGDHDQAHGYLQRALGIKSRLRGAQDLDVGITWSNLGFVLGNAGRWSEANDAFDQAQAIFAATVGPNHPLNDVARTGLCRVAAKRRYYGIALDLCTDALRRLESTTTSPALVSRVKISTAKALRGLGRLGEARQMALEARAHVDGLDSRKVADIDEWIEELQREIQGTPPEGTSDPPP